MIRLSNNPACKPVGFQCARDYCGKNKQVKKTEIFKPLSNTSLLSLSLGLGACHGIYMFFNHTQKPFIFKTYSKLIKKMIQAYQIQSTSGNKGLSRKLGQVFAGKYSDAINNTSGSLIDSLCTGIFNTVKTLKKSSGRIHLAEPIAAVTGDNPLKLRGKLKFEHNFDKIFEKYSSILSQNYEIEQLLGKNQIEILRKKAETLNKIALQETLQNIVMTTLSAFSILKISQHYLSQKDS